MKFTVERDFSSSIHLYKIQKKYLINVLSSSIFLNFQFKKLASLSSRYITMMEQNRNHVPCETLNEWDCTYFSVWWKIKSNSGERETHPVGIVWAMRSILRELPPRTHPPAEFLSVIAYVPRMWRDIPLSISFHALTF